MDPKLRYDVYISYHGVEKLSPTDSFTMHNLAAQTAEKVRNCTNFLRTAPSVYFDSTASTNRIDDIVEAILRTRPNGVVLFLLTPAFFSESRCAAELRAFLEVQSDPEVNLKLIFVCFGSVDNMKEQEPALSDFVLRTDVTATSIHATSARLFELVFKALECTTNVSPQYLPTVVGSTCRDSYLALQSVFFDDDLPLFRAILSLPRNVTNMLDAFGELSLRNVVTQTNVKELKKVIAYQTGPTADTKLRMVEAYEQKWDLSQRLDWGVELREKLSYLMGQNESATQGSSSSGHQKRIRNTSTNIREMSELDAKRLRGTAALFKPFDTPPLSRNIVLDFETRDEKDDPATTEGRLLRKVLEPINGEDHRTVSASGKPTNATLGMGGVGKTTALKALCYHEEVKKSYPDGICFLEFGEDANDRKVIDQVARCVHIFGGRNEAQEMKASSDLSDVVQRAAAWLCNRTVLLLCDELWKNKKSKYGYLNDVTNLLREAPGSCLVISTRDRNIAESADEIVEFAPLDVKGGKAREILLADVRSIGVGANIQDTATEDLIRCILRICAGLPLALAIAGRGLKKTLRYCKTLCNAVKQYYERLKPDGERLTVEELENYPGLAKVIELSLKQCQEWGMNGEAEQQYGRKLDMEYMFKGLCVLEKQMLIPARALKHVWGTDDKCTNAVMDMFADCNLANCSESGQSTEHELGLQLHDLVLLRCHQMAGDDRSKMHERLVDAYAKKVGGVRSVEGGEEGVKCRAWWDARDDGYFYAHLSRHLVLSGQELELRSLLCDTRWSMRRLEVGGWVSLNVDFERLFGAQEHEDRGIRRVHEVLMNSLPYARERPNLLAFYICAHLSAEERKESTVSSLYQSILSHFPKPWLLPATRYIAAKDEREKWKTVFEGDRKVFPRDLTVDWRRGIVVITDGESILSWCTNKHRIIQKIPYRASCIAVSADGKVIVSGSTDRTVRRWDSETGAPIGDPLLGHRHVVTCVAISADGNFIVSGSRDDTVRRWDAESGALIGNLLRGHEFLVTCVATIADVKCIVSGSTDWTVRRWNAESGAPIGDPLHGHEDWVRCVAVSADGKLIVSGSDDNTVRRWDAKSGVPIGDPLRGHVGFVTSVAISADAKCIVSGSRDNTVRRWDAESGAPVGDPLRGHEGWVTSVAVSADGKDIVSGSRDKTVREWDVENEIHSGEPILGPENHGSAVPESSDGSATVGTHHDPVRGDEDTVTCVAISADGKAILSVSADWTVRQWDPESGAPIGDPLRGHEDWVRCVAVSADGTLIVSGSDDYTVRRWDAKSGAPIGDPLCGHEDSVTCVAISADRKMIVSGSWDYTVRRWDARSGTPIGDPLRGHEFYVTCVAISADGRFLVSGSRDRTVRRWDAESGAPIGDPLRGHKHRVSCIAISADGKCIVSGSWDNAVRRWDAESWGSSGDILHIHENRVTFVALSDDGSIVESICAPNRILLWDKHAVPSVGSSLSLQLHRSALEFITSFTPNMSCLTMSLDGRFVVVGSKKDEVKIFRWVE